MLKTVPVRRWTMHHDADFVAAATEFGGFIQWLSTVNADRYLQFYKRTGERWNWRDRLMMPREQLRQILDSPQTAIGEFHLPERQEAGFVELHCHAADNIEIRYFGLFPEFTGLGLGTEFLCLVIMEARRRLPPQHTLWLTTCETDSPAARPLYQRMGFRVVGEDIQQHRVWPGDSP